jgi:MerR family transcriptional regulator/heat shock protein HspR
MAQRFSEPLFVISVAARLVEMHPQTLRKYEREGLIAPSRTSGNLRLYSDQDIERLRQVKYLVEERSMNLAGVQMALDLTRELLALRERLDEHDSHSRVVRKELSKMLGMLGHIDQEKIRKQAR